MWIEIRKFYETIFGFSDFDEEERVDELLAEVEKYKWRLQNLLQNPVRNWKNQQKMRKKSKKKIFFSSISNFNFFFK